MKKQTFRRIITCMEGTKVRYFVGLFGLSFLVFVMQTQIAYMFLDLFDTLLVGDFDDVLDVIVLPLIIVSIVFVLIPLFVYLLQKAIVFTTGHIRRQAFDKLCGLPVGYFKHNHSADITSKLTNDITEMEKSYSNLLVDFIINAIVGVGTTTIMFFLDWRLSLIAVITAIITVYINTIYAKRIRQVSTKIQDQLGTLNTKLSNIISGIHVIKIFNIQALVLKAFNRSNTDVKTVSIDRVKKQSYINGVNTLVGLISFVVIISVGAYFVLIGQTTIGTIVAITQLQNGIRQLSQSLGDFITNLQGSLAAGDRVFELFDEKTEPATYDQSVPRVTQAPIVLDDLTFAYDDDTVLDCLNLDLGKHQTAALVGPSGGGKSTVFKLLLQFYPPQSGGMVINHKPAAHQTIKDIRHMIAYVPQDAHLFNCSVKENILYGRLDATDEAVISAAKSANAHDFISQLPNGYDTVVGENGATLSGGQRQRVAIARALLKDAPILLLDEATSALDNESEKLVQEALERLMVGKVSFVIAHRLSTVEHSDCIYVIDQGKVVEKGTHQTLLKQNGLYTSLNQPN